ncbi:hypothetical protein O181_025077 [Austropuccinia psidii MF-1]|uniref:Integrase catalytic domain-containing protein n=1 Tax=Austropuccinia psidii MF-1 TaxID=1389203 RepID=A0A9Q3CKH0_9BASI|nr:hypothetical protein [Austropuccinia psidii MF-1]
MDNGREFTSICFQTSFQTHGIIPHYTAPYTPQKNPVAERGNNSTTEKGNPIIASPTPHKEFSSQGAHPTPSSSLSPSEPLIEPSTTAAARPGWDIVVHPLNQKS